MHFKKGPRLIEIHSEKPLYLSEIHLEKRGLFAYVLPINYLEIGPNP